MAPQHTMAHTYVAMSLAQLGRTGEAQIEIAELTWRPGHAAISATRRLASDKGARLNEKGKFQKAEQYLCLDVAR